MRENHYEVKRYLEKSYFVCEFIVCVKLAQIVGLLCEDLIYMMKTASVCVGGITCDGANIPGVNSLQKTGSMKANLVSDSYCELYFCVFFLCDLLSLSLSFFHFLKFCLNFQLCYLLQKKEHAFCGAGVLREGWGAGAVAAWRHGKKQWWWSMTIPERTESHTSCFLLALKFEVLRKGFSYFSIKPSQPHILCYLSSYHYFYLAFLCVPRVLIFYHLIN